MRVTLALVAIVACTIALVAGISLFAGTVPVGLAKEWCNDTWICESLRLRQSLLAAILVGSALIAASVVSGALIISAATVRGATHRRRRAAGRLKPAHHLRQPRPLGACDSSMAAAFPARGTVYGEERALVTPSDERRPACRRELGSRRRGSLAFAGRG